MKGGSIFFFLLVFVVLSFFGIWRYLSYKKVQPPVHVLLYDQSDSKIKGCGCLRSRALRLMENISMNGERIVLSSLGTPETGYEPEVIETYVVSGDDSPLAGRTKRFEEKNRILSDLESKCESIARTKTTPLFQGLKTTVEDLKAKCPSNTRCSVFVQTDLEEIVDKRIVQAFKNEKERKTATALPQIDNSDLSITFSGISEVVISSQKQADKVNKAAQKLGDGDVWQKVWKRVFTHPELVSFEQICSTSKKP